MKKTYVITGTTSGIGKNLLEVFAKNNIVFAGYRNEKYLEDLNEYTIEDANDVAKKYLNFQNSVTTVLLPE